MTIEKSQFFILRTVSVCIKTTSGFGISLSEQDFIADSRVPGQLAYFAHQVWVKNTTNFVPSKFGLRSWARSVLTYLCPICKYGYQILYLWTVGKKENWTQNMILFFLKNLMSRGTKKLIEKIYSQKGLFICVVDSNEAKKRGGFTTTCSVIFVFVGNSYFTSF